MKGNTLKLVIQAYDFGVIGGISIYIKSFLDSIPNSEKMEITVITADRSGIDLKENNNYKIIKVPYKGGRLSLISWSRQCQKIISEMKKKNQVDVVNLHTPPFIPGLFPVKDIPYVITFHNPFYCWSKNLPYKISAPDKLIRIITEKKLIKLCSEAITLTPESVLALKKMGAPDSKINLIPNGTNPEIFKPNKKSKKYDVLFCGRLQLMKGSSAMVSLCKMLCNKKKNIKISIVGVGEEFDNVSSALKKEIESGNVVMQGKVPHDKVFSHYKDSKIYVSTSYAEGLPTTCIEAMSSALPAVVWNLPFYQGLLDNKSGILIEKDNYDKMTLEIIKLLNSPLQVSKKGNAGRDKILKSYDWKIITPKILSVIKKAIK